VLELDAASYAVTVTSVTPALSVVELVQFAVPDTVGVFVVAPVKATTTLVTPTPSLAVPDSTMA
jgi:hypothetical protein